MGNGRHYSSPFKGEVRISRDLAAVVWRLSRLLSGFIRGMGCTGREFMTHPHPIPPLAPRDTVPAGHKGEGA